MKLLLLWVICLLFVYMIDARKHHHKRGNDKKRHNKLDSTHGGNSPKHKVKFHHRHHVQKKKHLRKMERKIKNKIEEQRSYLKIREQIRDLSERINNMLPRCGKDKKCPKNTCCWKGRCKMLPHRVNQRCSTSCPCDHHKKALFCHTKKKRNRKDSYGRCYIKGNSLGVHNLNFIPKAIEKFKKIEKRIKKERHG